MPSHLIVLYGSIQCHMCLSLSYCIFQFSAKRHSMFSFFTFKLRRKHTMQLCFSVFFLLCQNFSLFYIQFLIFNMRISPPPNYLQFMMLSYSSFIIFYIFLSSNVSCLDFTNLLKLHLFVISMSCVYSKNFLQYLNDFFEGFDISRKGINHVNPLFLCHNSIA